MTRLWAMPTADTFDCPPIRDFVKKYLRQSKVSIDPFARNKRLATHTNDLNPATAAEFHMTALEFLEILKERGVKSDLVIFDPPYSMEQCKRVYESVGRAVTMQDTQDWGRWTREKRLIAELLDIGGVCLSFGWNSNGVGLQNLFKIEEIMIVAHGGAHNDTICLAERKLAHQPILI